MMSGAMVVLNGTHVKMKYNDAFNSCYDYKNHVTMNDWKSNIVSVVPNYTEHFVAVLLDVGGN